jgi:hypothetical protein
MNKTKIPDWLKKILDDSGLEQGKYVFNPDGVEISGLPDEFVGIAESNDGGLAVTRTGRDGVIYRFEDGKIDVMAINKEEFVVEMKRDEAWESLEENMPAVHSFGVGIVLVAKSSSGERMILGTKGSVKPSALVISGQVKQDEMLIDAIKRELEAALEISDFEIVDVLDDGGILEEKKALIPSFRIEVEVEAFPVRERVKNALVDWVVADEKRQVN